MSGQISGIGSGPTPNLDDFAQVGELARTPSVIPSKGEDALVERANTAGSFGAFDVAGRFENLRGLFTDSADVSQPCDLAVEQYEAALKTNEEVRAHNADIDKQLRELEEQAHHLRTLFSHPLAQGDGVLTWGELEELSLTSKVDDVRAAATWLMGHPEIYRALPRKGTFLGGDNDFQRTGFADGAGIDVKAATAYLATLARKHSDLKAQRREEVPMPPLPTESVAAAAAGAVGTWLSAPASASTGGAAATMEGALSNLNRSLGALEAEIAEVTAKANSEDPKVAAEARARLQILNQRLQVMTSMMTMLSTMMSNMAKLYSDMSMTAVRNMK